MKRKNIFGLAAAVSVMLSAIPCAVPCTAFAEDSVLYGTMNIPYADFYAAEFGTSPNAYEVDAYSSATTTKWSKNGAGELFEGTYHQPNADGTGSILGVVYPVAITQSALDELAENNYDFTALDTIPAAYKTVIVTDGKASFSAVQDSMPETASGAQIKLSTATPWGDYLMDVENKPEMGAIYGALIRTADGKTYAMRHEENIWRGELAWSSGIRTSEAHGNPLSYEHFVDLMGATINEVTFITADGYVTIPTETYVPVKFVGEVKIDNAASGTGSTTFTLTGFPEDFDKAYTLADGFTVTGSEITYADAMPGSYTLIVSDNSGKYADLSGSFTLTTDSMPAAYADKKLVKADGASDAEFANFLKNIAKVTVGETAYTASGKGAVRIIGEDGTIDFSAASRNGNVFDGSGNYVISVSATGYSSTLDFTVVADMPETSPETTTETAASSDTASSGTSGSSSTSAGRHSTTASATNARNTATQVSSSPSPKTGDAGVAIPLAALAIAGAALVTAKRKEQ